MKGYENILAPHEVLVDVETTGIDPSRHGMIQVAVTCQSRIDTHGREEVAKEWACRPRVGCEIDPGALAVNGTTVESLEVFGCSEKSLMEALREWFRDELAGKKVVLVGINPFFDKAFLETAWRRHFGQEYTPWTHRVRDIGTETMAIQRILEGATAVPNGGYNTDQLYAYWGLRPEPKPHSASSGVIYEMELLKKLRQAHDTIGGQPQKSQSGKGDEGGAK